MIINKKLLIIVSYINKIKLIKKIEKNNENKVKIFQIMNPEYDFFDVIPIDQLSKNEILDNLKINDNLSFFDYDNKFVIKLKIIYVIDFGSSIFVQIEKNHNMDKYIYYVINIEENSVRQISHEANIKMINF